MISNQTLLTRGSLLKNRWGPRSTFCPQRSIVRARPPPGPFSDIHMMSMSIFAVGLTLLQKSNLMKSLFAPLTEPSFEFKEMLAPLNTGASVALNLPIGVNRLRMLFQDEPQADGNLAR